MVNSMTLCSFDDNLWTLKKIVFIKIATNHKFLTINNKNFSTQSIKFMVLFHTITKHFLICWFCFYLLKTRLCKAQFRRIRWATFVKLIRSHPINSNLLDTQIDQLVYRKSYHMLYQGKVGDEYPCTVCNKMFSSLSSVKTHLFVDHVSLLKGDYKYYINIISKNTEKNVMCLLFNR